MKEVILITIGILIILGIILVFYMMLKKHLKLKKSLKEYKELGDIYEIYIGEFFKFAKSPECISDINIYNKCKENIKYLNNTKNDFDSDNISANIELYKKRINYMENNCIFIPYFVVINRDKTIEELLE